jgi:CubicO group peptidase (beta-lactamase class C family)
VGIYTQLKSQGGEIIKIPRQLFTSFSLIALTGIFFQGNSIAGIVDLGLETDWRSQRDLTSQEFSRAFVRLSRQGFMMTDIDAYPDGNRVAYSAIWQRNSDGRNWKEHRGMTSSRYNERWREYQTQGYRPLDVEAYRVGNNVRWAGIWIENRENIPWRSYRNLTSRKYGELFREKSRQDFRLIDMEAYWTPQGIRYAAIWYKNVDNIPWAQVRNMTRQRYQAEVDRRAQRGQVVIDYESYETPSGQRYAAIFARVPGHGWNVRTNLSETQFANIWRQNRDRGMRLVDFERYNTDHGVRYAGVWAENNLRFRWQTAELVDTLVENYRTDPQNNIPGMSVAIIRNGDLVYRKGFGHADVARNRVAHGETVYNIASIAKVIGGTLAVKMEREGRLRDGTRVDFDLSRNTRDYLEAIPARGSGGDLFFSLPEHHTHTLEDIVSHRACITHYRTSPVVWDSRTNGVGTVRTQVLPVGVEELETHFQTAVQSAVTFWDQPLVTFTDTTFTRGPGGNITSSVSQPFACSVGTNWRYSTAAFTLLGAAMEVAADRSIIRLVNEEIADQYGLQSMRVRYTTDELPYNYERSLKYNGQNNRLIEFKDNSWKVLGGGIEASAADVARFGWKILDGEIVSDTDRNGRLFNNLPRSNYGIAWRVETDRAGRNIAQHGGSATGARTHLRLYTNDDLVIAIMSNKKDPGTCDVGSLSDSIADAILGPRASLTDCAGNPVP